MSQDFGIFSNSTNSNNTCEEQQQNPVVLASASVVLIVISCVICVTGFVANVVIAVVIVKVEKMHTTTNWLVLNLAIADLAIVIITIPYNLINPFISWPFGYIGCKYLIMPTMEHFASVCVLTHTSISLARYINIKRALLEEIVSTKIVAAVIIFIWVISFLVLSATLMGLLGEFQLIERRGKRLLCKLVWISHSRRKVYRVCVFILTYCIPMITTGYSYCKIHCIVKRSLKNVRKLLTQEILANRRRKTRQVNSSLMFMYAMFALITLPLQLFLFLVDFHLIGNLGHFESPNLKSVFDILVTVFYVQILSNPLVLMYKRHEYLKALKDLRHACCLLMPTKRKLIIAVEGSMKRIYRYRKHVTISSSSSSKGGSLWSERKDAIKSKELVSSSDSENVGVLRTDGQVITESVTRKSSLSSCISIRLPLGDNLFNIKHFDKDGWECSYGGEGKQLIHCSKHDNHVRTRVVRTAYQETLI